MSVVMTECWAVEVYLPKKLEHLPELYSYLRAKLGDSRSANGGEAAINGFSVYEVDGAFFGDRVYQERTLVIRILFLKTAEETADSIRPRLAALGSEIASQVALTEEEIWICHWPQVVSIFRPDRGGKGQ
jgi:hypothetical protein